MNRDIRLVADTGGARLDQYLARSLPGYSRSFLKDLAQRGLVLVDGAPRAPDFRLRHGSVVVVRASDPGWAELPFEDWVLHEDRHILVVDKPAGLITHPVGESWIHRPEAALSEPEPSLAGVVLRHRPGMAASGVERCGLVHRLDRQTSGVLVLAKTAECQTSLLCAFRERRVRKAYRAVVMGRLQVCRVEAPVGRSPGRRRIRVTPWGREASTEFRSIETRGPLSLVEARPLTGRTHQIRVHLASVKLPVLGDPEWFRDAEQKALTAAGLPKPPRMLLHAYRLSFEHPGTGKAVRFSAPVPADMRDYWKAVRSLI
ncbi:MAG: RluA family pseudouridine synthase [Elusimicrobiota bacterium]